MPLYIALLVALGVAAAIWTVVAERRKKVSTDRRAETAVDRERRQHAKAEELRQPYRYADDNGLLVFGESVWGIYRMGGLTDDLYPSVEVQGFARQQDAELHAFAQNGNRVIDCQLIGTRRPFDVDQWESELLTHSADPSELYVQYIGRLKKRVAARGAANPAAYLAVKLGSLKGGGVSALDAAPLPSQVPIDGSGQQTLLALAAGKLLNVSEETLTAGQAGGWQSVADYVPHALPAWGLHPATRKEIVFLIREPWYGSLPVPTEPVLESRPWGPGDFDLVLETEGFRKPGYMHLAPGDLDDSASDRGTDSYTATLVVTKWPDSISFNKATAWMRMAMRVNPNVRLSTRFSLIPPTRYAKLVDEATADLLDEVNDLTIAQRARTQSPDATAEELVPAEMWDQLTTTTELSKNIRENRIPGVQTQPRFSVSAPTLDALQQSVTDLRREMFKIHIELELPRKLQLRLLQERCLGDAPKFRFGTRQWGRLTGTPTISGGIPASSSEVGDEIEWDRGHARGWLGPPIGWSRSTWQPVLYSNFVQMARNQGAGVALIGASGNGKSNLMMLLFFQDSESGARTVAIDPKGDIAQFCYYLAFGSQMVHPQIAADANAGILGTPKSQFQPTNPQFWADTSIVDVTKAADGSLDPFNISDDVQLGKERALTALQTLIEPADWEKIRSVVNEALVAAMAPYYRIAAATEERIEARYEAMAHPDLAALNAEKANAVRGLAERPNLWKVRNQIKEMAATYTGAGHVGDDAAAWRLAASKMDEIAGDGKANKGMRLARLMFSPEPTLGLDIGRRRRTVYTISGVKTPSATSARANWRPQERAAAAIMYLITAACSDILDNGDKHPKAVYVDEAHVLSSGLEEGRIMVVEGFRKGRSWNGAVVVASQQPDDLDKLNSQSDTDGDTGGNHVPTVFAFKQRSDPAAGKMANILRSKGADNPVLLRSLLSLRTGRGVMRDSSQQHGGRIGEVEFDLGFDELIHAADTNPVSFHTSHAHPVSASPADWTELPLPGSTVSTQSAGTAA